MFQAQANPKYSYPANDSVTSSGLTVVATTYPNDSVFISDSVGNPIANSGSTFTVVAASPGLGTIYWSVLGIPNTTVTISSTNDPQFGTQTYSLIGVGSPQYNNHPAWTSPTTYGTFNYHVVFNGGGPASVQDVTLLVKSPAPSFGSFIISSSSVAANGSVYVTVGNPSYVGSYSIATSAGTVIQQPVDDGNGNFVGQVQAPSGTGSNPITITLSGNGIDGFQTPASKTVQFNVAAAPAPTFTMYGSTYFSGNFNNVGDSFNMKIYINNATSVTWTVSVANSLSFGGFQNGANDVPTTILPAAYGQQITVTITATNSGGSTQFPFIIPTTGTIGNANYPETLSVSPTNFAAATGTTVSITGIPNTTINYGVSQSSTPVFNSGSITIDGTGGGGSNTWTNTAAFAGASPGNYYLHVQWATTGRTQSVAVTAVAPGAAAPTITSSVGNYVAVDSGVTPITITIANASSVTYSWSRIGLLLTDGNLVTITYTGGLVNGDNNVYIYDSGAYGNYILTITAGSTEYKITVYATYPYF